MNTVFLVCLCDCVFHMHNSKAIIPLLLKVGPMVILEITVCVVAVYIEIISASMCER